MIDNSTATRIFETANIVEVVQDFVNLKKRGVNYLGLCPFHNEKTPSFTVSPAKNIFKCFGCGKGGNSVHFIREHENVDYWDALRYLAKKYHIEIVEREITREEIEEKNKKESLQIITSFAQKYFTANLTETSEGKTIGLKYLIERGFNENVIEKFQLGYSLDKKDDFAKTAVSKGYKIDLLDKSGLVIRKENWQADRFRDRVIFPIHSLSGTILGFGGRILRSDKKSAKYINSPETELYSKSKVLYGIFQAKKSMIQENKCYLVEGYTDVISLHQAGIENVVASSGTSLTNDQIRLIKRFTPNITILYDGDEAGIKASLRGINMILEQGLNTKVLLFPEGEDPDSFVQNKSSSVIEKYIAENEKDFILFKTNLLLKGNENDPLKVAGLIDNIVQSIAVIPARITRSVYIKECSTLLDVKEELLYAEVNKHIRRQANSKIAPIRESDVVRRKTTSPSQLQSQIEDGYETIEKKIITLLFKYGNNTFSINSNSENDEKISISVAQFIIDEITKDDLIFKNTLYNFVFNEIKLNYSKNQQINEKYFINHQDAKINSLVAEILSTQHSLSDFWQKRSGLYIATEEMNLNVEIPETILTYKIKKVNEMINDVQKQGIEAQNKNKVEEIIVIQQKIVQLITLRKELANDIKERIVLK